MYEGRLSNCVQFFDKKYFLVGRVEISTEGGLGGLRREGVSWDLDSITFPHPDFPHSDMVNV